MGSQAIANTILVLRIFTILALAVCVVVFVIDTVTVKIIIRTLTITDGTELSFKDIHAFRYVFATAVIGAAYSLLQLPLAIYHVSTGKRLIRHGAFKQLDFYADQVTSFVLASGVGGGFAISFEFKSILKDFFKAIADPTIPEIEESRANYVKFLNRSIIATSLLCLGFFCMVAIVLTSIHHRRGRKA